QADVVDRLMALHQRRLEVQRLRLVAGDDVLDRAYLRGQRAHLGLEAARRTEVGAHTITQAARLADVNHIASRVAHDVDARLLRERPNLGLNGVGGHISMVSRRGSAYSEKRVCASARALVLPTGRNLDCNWQVEAPTGRLVLAHALLERLADTRAHL